jgi:hypothetical protein
VSCRYHLAVDVERPDGALRLNHDGATLQQHDMSKGAYYARFTEVPLARRFAELVAWYDDRPTCALDVVGETSTRTEVGELLGITRDVVHKVERRALKKVERRLKELSIDAETFWASLTGKPEADNHTIPVGAGLQGLEEDMDMAAPKVIKVERGPHGGKPQRRANRSKRSRYTREVEKGANARRLAKFRGKQ